MKIASAAHVEPAADCLRVQWRDGSSADFPLIWLRDNCSSGFHPDTAERQFDLLSVPERPRARSAWIEGDALLVDWAGEPHRSRFPLDWLRAHAPGVPAADPAEIAPVLWRGDTMADRVPRYDAEQILREDAALLGWMTETAETGVSVVENLADHPAAGVAIAERVGFLRRTNFGVTFEVESKPSPNNLAYTAEALPLHTDLPNQEVPPGYQFLHCLANGAAGGGSLLADGFALASDLRSHDPDAFDLLSEVPIPFRFHDGDADIRVRRPVITLDPAGEPVEIRWNAHIAGILDLAPVETMAYYRAYRAFMARTRDPRAILTLRLRPGEMVVFDNRRVLHGREAFDPSTGRRHLTGCYVDRGEFASRLRTLARGA